MSVRALRPVPDAAPEMFIAIPLPELGRYRVSMLAPPDLARPSGGTAHGIQSERPAPGIAHLQAVAGDLLPEEAVLSDLRWSSLFRISMRLAANYRSGNVFISEDAAHVNPPTGGQGMNTGIQDAYNLAWKLALVLNGSAGETLLDSYEAERRAVGADVVARTTEASVKLGREGGDSARLTDTQVLVSCRGSAWVMNAAPGAEEYPGPVAGDRAPDCHGLRRHGFGFPLRMFDPLRGTEHVLVASCPGPDPTSGLADLATLTAEIGRGGLVRSAAIIEPGARVTEWPGLPTYQDADGGFRKTYGSSPTAMLVRPDGHLAWRGESCREAGLIRILERTFSAKVPAQKP